MNYIRIDRSDGSEENIGREPMIERLNIYITDAKQVVRSAEREAKRTGLGQIHNVNTFAYYEIRA